jgi:hypothetical protein
MKSSTKFPNLALLAVFFLLTAGCAVDKKPSASQGGSSLPWNRPQSWEGAGMMGGMMSGTP